MSGAPSKWTVYLAAFAVLVVVYLVYVVKWMNARADKNRKSGRETFKQHDNGDEEDDYGTKKDKEYETRMYTMKIFDAVLKRPATNAEIEKYGSLSGETAILRAVLRDYNLMNVGDSDDFEANREKHNDRKDQLKVPSNKAADKHEEKDDNDEDRRDDKRDDGGEKTRQKGIASMEEAAINGVRPGNADAQNDIFGQFDEMREEEELVLPSERDKNKKDAPSSSSFLSNRVCLDKTDLLRRLKAISSETNQLYHMVSMY